MTSDFLTADPNDGQEYETQCARCGSSIEWEPCDACGGDGFYGHDCGEDCCACLYPDDNVRCDICEGRGGWERCLSSADYCEQHPMPGRESVHRSAVEYFALPSRSDGATPADAGGRG